MTEKGRIIKIKLASNLRDSILVGLLAFFAVYVNFHYMAKIGFSEILPQKIAITSIDRFLLFQIIAALPVSLICALAGTFFAKRYKLAGIGSFESLKKGAPWIFGFLVIGIPLTIFLYDRPILSVTPWQYPKQWYWALGVAVSSALSVEIIARFGMLTIFKGIVRNFWTANILQAVFVTALATKSLALSNITVGLNYLTIIGVFLSLVGSLAAGWLYYRFGIAASILAHILFAFRTLLFLI